MRRSYVMEFEQDGLSIRIVRHQSEQSKDRAEVEIETTSYNGSGTIWLTGELQLFLLKEAIDNYIEVFHLKKEDEDDGQDEE